MQQSVQNDESSLERSRRYERLVLCCLFGSVLVGFAAIVVLLAM